MAQWLARGAHNSEVTRSKRVAGIKHHIALVHRGTGATKPGWRRGSARGEQLRGHPIKTDLRYKSSHRIGASRHWSNKPAWRRGSARGS